MNPQFARSCLTFGSENMEKLARSRIIVFGIGGVGGYVVEALVRSGIGAIDIVDDDAVCLSNLNRQIYALHSTLGQSKVDVAEKRILDINPQCRVTKHKTFFLPQNAHSFDFSKYDYIVDCIDTVSGKIAIVEKAKSAKKPVICAMGAGNKTRPDQLKIADISKTSVCPLARVMRNEFKKRGIKKVKCVFSTEKPIPPRYDDKNAAEPQEEKSQAESARPSNPGGRKKLSPGSNAFVPATAGLMIAAEIIRDLTGFANDTKK